MFTRSRSMTAASMVVLAFCLAALGPASARTLEWVSGNSANNHVSELDWEQLQSLLLNTDSSDYSSLVSFAFRTNTCGNDVGTEILAADTNRGWLVRYTADDNYADGTVFCDSSIAGCPARPEGLSIAQDGKLAVASSGQGSSTPSVTIMDEAACGGGPAKPFPYENPRSTGPICFGSNGTCASYPDSITDTAFVRVPGGGFNVGDLIIVANPGTVAYIKAGDLPAAGQPTPAHTVATTLASSVLGGNVTSGAWVTGTGGAGAAATFSLSEQFVVTVSGGIVKILRWQKDASGNPILETGSGPLPLLFSSPLGNGPLGITAGALADRSYIGLSRRNQGTLNRCEIDVSATGIADANGASPGLLDISSCDSIQDAQNPQDIILNTDVLAAEDCDANVNDGDNDGLPGCVFNKTVRLTYTQDTTSDQNVAADIRIIEVDCSVRPPLTFAQLGLPGDYSVPYHTWPISLGDDQSCIYVYADFEDDIDISAGNFIFSDVLIGDLLDELVTCRVERFEQVYHPERGSSDPDEMPYGDSGVLYPIDTVCQNPPGGLKRDNSPSIFGVNSFLLRLEDGSRQATRGIDKDIKDEASYRYDALVTLISDSTLGNTAKSAILAALSPVATSIKKKKFGEASDLVDAAVVNAIAPEAEDGGAFKVAGVPATLYGDVLGLSLNLSYFLWEVGNYPGHYCPPEYDGENLLADVGVMCTGKTAGP